MHFDKYFNQKTGQTTVDPTMAKYKLYNRLIAMLLLTLASALLFSTAASSLPAPNSPACKATFSIIEIKYVGKQTPTIQSKTASSIMCTGKTIPARYIINTRITKSSDPASTTKSSDQCERLYPPGKNIQLTLLLPTRGPANQFQDRTIVEGTIKMDGDVCDHGVFLTDYRIPTREEMARLAPGKTSFTTIAPPGKLLASSPFKTCKKHPMPSCPGGRILPGRKGPDGCFSASVCLYSKLPGTCENKCGWTAGSGRCSCDIQCTMREDCCTDYSQLCTPKKCPDVTAPVCSKDGVTYKNSCQAELSSAKIACKGSCPCKIACPVYKDVPCLEGTVVPGSKLRNGCDGPPVCKNAVKNPLVGVGIND